MNHSAWKITRALTNGFDSFYKVQLGVSQVPDTDGLWIASFTAASETYRCNS